MLIYTKCAFPKQMASLVCVCWCVFRVLRGRSGELLMDSNGHESDEEKNGAFIPQ